MDFKRMVMSSVPVLGLLALAGIMYVFFLTDAFDRRPAGPSDSEEPLDPPVRAREWDGLLLLCDENIRYPVEAPDVRHEGGVVGRFSRRHGVRIHVRNAPVEELVASLKREPEGDIILAGDAGYVEELQDAGLVLETRDVARLVPVIVVRRENPFSVTCVSDLSNTDIRLAIGGAREGLMRRNAVQIFRNHGMSLYEMPNVRLTGDVIAHAARAVELNDADAAVVWRPLGRQHPRNTKIVEINPEYNVVSTVTAAVLNVSPDRDTAVRFIDYLTGRASMQIFEMYGFDVDE